MRLHWHLTTRTEAAALLAENMTHPPRVLGRGPASSRCDQENGGEAARLSTTHGRIPVGNSEQAQGRLGHLRSGPSDSRGRHVRLSPRNRSYAIAAASSRKPRAGELSANGLSARLACRSRTVHAESVMQEPLPQRPAGQQSFSTDNPSYFVVASTSGSASPTVLTISNASAGFRLIGLRFIEAE